MLKIMILINLLSTDELKKFSFFSRVSDISSFRYSTAIENSVKHKADTTSKRRNGPGKTEECHKLLTSTSPLLVQYAIPTLAALYHVTWLQRVLPSAI